MFTTSDPPNIRIPILQIFVFVIEGGQENIFSLVEKVISKLTWVILKGTNWCHLKKNCNYPPMHDHFLFFPYIFFSLRKFTSNLFVTSKLWNHEFSNSPIHEFKVLQNVFKVFKMKKQGLKCQRGFKGLSGIYAAL